jgi:hypothetical protein
VIPMNLFALLNDISGHEGLRFLMIGGHAVNAYGYSRITHDLDILLSRDDRQGWLTAMSSSRYTLQHDGGGFLQFAPPIGDLWPLDLMIAAPQTFAKMLDASREVQQGEFKFRVPSLEHMFVLKLHALKEGAKSRHFKDFMDILSLVQANGVDIRNDSFRELCEKYGSKEVYERIIAFQP